MINVNPSSPLINFRGQALDVAIRSALRLAADISLVSGDLVSVDLDEVHTKKNVRAAFAKFVTRRLLPDKTQPFDVEYVQAAFDVVRRKSEQMSKGQFDFLMRAETNGALAYRMRYVKPVRIGFGLFLVALHSSGAITLPISFSWPSVQHPVSRKRREVAHLVASELLAFVRSLDSQSDAFPHPAFAVVGGDRKRKEWFLTYATKLLLATGWHRPEDVNLADLLSIRMVDKTNDSFATTPLDYRALLDVLNAAFGNRVRLSVDEWSEALRAEKPAPRRGSSNSYDRNTLERLRNDGPSADHDLVNEVLHIEPVWGRPEHLKLVTRLPGLEFDLQASAKVWLQVEDLYMRKTSRESYKTIRAAIAFWNIYLFYYLPHWLGRNRSSSLRFPATPSQLQGSAFVSRLLTPPEDSPTTFVEFMSAQSAFRGWVNNNAHYSLLLQLQSFFEFIERFSDEIPGCEGFSQPLSAHDYPRTSRPKATKKQPVPRRFFAVYLDYIEALLAHQRVVSSRILAGEMNSSDAPRCVQEARESSTRSVPRKASGSFQCSLPRPRPCHCSSFLTYWNWARDVSPMVECLEFHTLMRCIRTL